MQEQELSEEAGRSCFASSPRSRLPLVSPFSRVSSCTRLQKLPTGQHESLPAPTLPSSVSTTATGLHHKNVVLDRQSDAGLADGTRCLVGLPADVLARLHASLYSRADVPQLTADFLLRPFRCFAMSPTRPSPCSGCSPSTCTLYPPPAASPPPASALLVLPLPSSPPSRSGQWGRAASLWRWRRVQERRKSSWRVRVSEPVEGEGG